MNAPSERDELTELGELGVDRVVFTIWPQEPDAVLSELDRFTSIADLRSCHVPEFTGLPAGSVVHLENAMPAMVIMISISMLTLWAGSKR